MIQVKRVYEKASAKDGFRVLVDRLWPRGLTKERAAVDLWLKELGPSTELRKWFGHDPEKWPEFQARYREELAHKKEALELLRQKGKQQLVTLLYGARDKKHNDARVLEAILGGRGHGRASDKGRGSAKRAVQGRARRRPSGRSGTG